MQIICPISGRAWQRDDLFTGIECLSVHPIFLVKKKDLLTADIVHRFSKSLNNLERKMYFLAVLNASELVYFNAVASPSVRTVEANFLQLIDTTGWLDYAQFQIGRDVAFPKYVVGKDNSDLSNINEWIASIQAIRTSFLQKDIDRERSRTLHLKMQQIQRELASAFLKDQAFTSALVDWAFEFEMPDQPAGITQKKLEDHPRAAFYKDVLTSKLTMAFTIDKGVLPEIHNFLYNNLPMYHPVRVPIMGQLQQLMAAQKKGFNDWEIVDREPDDIESVSGGNRKPTSMQQIEIKTRDAYVAETGGLAPPRREMFASKFLYLQALARFTIAKDAPKIIVTPTETEATEVPSIEEQVKEHFDEQQTNETGTNETDNDARDCEQSEDAEDVSKKGSDSERDGTKRLGDF